MIIRHKNWMATLLVAISFLGVIACSQDREAGQNMRAVFSDLSKNSTGNGLEGLTRKYRVALKRFDAQKFPSIDVGETYRAEFQSDDGIINFTLWYGNSFPFFLSLEIGSPWEIETRGTIVVGIWPIQKKKNM